MAIMLQNAGVRPTSPGLYRAFSWFAYWNLSRGFRAVRLAHEERLPQTQGPLIFFFNHASWWDPLLCVKLQRMFLPRRRHYAPMDAAALKHYAFFRHIGVFPIQMDTPRGAAQFLRGAQVILAEGGILWLTPQGQFVDVRRRPVELRPGLGGLLHRSAEVTAVPIAIEYTFWDQRWPEALVSFGEPVMVRDGRSTPSEVWTARLTEALTTAQDELASLAMTRDPKRFRALMEGARGTGGIYGLWQRIRSRLRGEIYQPDHEGRHPGMAVKP